MIRRAATSVIALTLAVLAACTSGPVVPPVADATRAAEARVAIERGDYASAREHYAELVRRSAGADRSRYQLELARAEVGLGSADAALAVLDAIQPPLPEGLDAGVAAVRADALFLLGRAVEAVRLLVEREIWLDTAAEILDNQNRIWAGLGLPLNRSAAGSRTGDALIDGWLALAPLTAVTGNEEEFRAALLAWRTDFPSHPAAGGILAERLAEIRGPDMRAPRVALLLPLGNPQTRLAALAVRDGIFAGYFAGGQADATDIRIYDTVQRGSLESYRDAQLEGADFIIGPLLTAEVDQVRSQVGFVPTLALNVSQQPTAATSNFYQFALSTDDEIEAIATRAVAAGHKTAVILHASNADGRRFGNAFRAAFESRGGRIIQSADYLSNGRDFANQIESLLNIDQSEGRRQRLAQNLGRSAGSIEFEPRRRQDIDMIFLQATPADARLLVPLLGRYDAAGIATYAMSDLYDPTRAGGDPDLNGVIFPDLPILLDPVGEAATAAELLSGASTPSARQFPRFFAFGFDAYLLAQRLYSGPAGVWPLAGATGELHLDDEGRIRRRLPFAEFNGGRPRSTGPATGLLLSAQ